MAQPALLFHDNTADFMLPEKPMPYGSVTLILRCAEGDVGYAFLCRDGQEITMSFYETRNGCDYYYARILAGNTPVSYRFRVRFTDHTACCYDRSGVYGEEEDERMPFFFVPGLDIPDWAKGCVIYQIFPDRFANGDAASDVLEGEYHYMGRAVKKITDWYEVPSPGEDFAHFYGGDLQGVINKLDYLAELGIEAIYFNPLFISPSSHKYDTQDYDHIDPHLGRIVADYGELPREGQSDNRHASRYICRTTHAQNTRATDLLFAKLVERAHKKGIRVILDGVFNHCGSFHRFLDRERIYEASAGNRKGAYLTPDSPYRHFFRFAKDSWPGNDSYEGWWEYETLPKLNYEESEELEAYILSVGVKWVSPPFNADGWRLDVAADLGHTEAYNLSFWKRFHDAVKKANPSAVLIAEHYGASGMWLKEGAWDSVMNYDGFMDPVSYFLTGMEKHGDDFRPELLGNHEAFWESMRQINGMNFPVQSAYAAMNQLSNHDHSRFLTRTNGRVGRVHTLGAEAASEGIRPEVFRQGAVMQFTWVGSPAIYYGDEAGLTGFTDPDNRRTYPWGREDKKMLLFHRELIALRRRCPELRKGSIREVYSERGLISYGRFMAWTASLIVINTNAFSLTRDFDVSLINVPKESVMKRVLISTEEGFRFHEVERIVKDGMLTLLIPPHAALIVRFDRRKRRI